MSNAQSRTRVKICGLTNAADLEVAINAGTDAVGVISDVPVDTPRDVTPERARELLEPVPPFVTGVLVTMPERPSAALELLESVRPDALQIHGGLSPTEVKTVGKSTDCDLIVAVDADELSQLSAYDGVADALLVDSVDADGGGGTGETHDWERTRVAIDGLESPVILAGGLTGDNVAEAIDIVDPFAVDVASGVEARGGSKDHTAVTRFVTAASQETRVRTQ